MKKLIFTAFLALTALSASASSSPSAELKQISDSIKKELIQLEKNEVECNNNTFSKKCYNKLIIGTLDAVEPMVLSLDNLVTGVAELSKRNEILEEKVKLQELLIKELQNKGAATAKSHFCTLDLRMLGASGLFSSSEASEELSRLNVIKECAKQLPVFTCNHPNSTARIQCK